jgi:pimeloyl-ACP methyl ester carboxylesterase
MGGYVALEIVRRAPERVAALALARYQRAARHPGADRSAARRNRRVGERLRGRGAGAVPSPPASGARRRPAHTDLLMAMALRIGREGYVRQQEAIIGRVDSRPSLARIACPTLVLCGREDVLLPLEVSEEMHAGSRARSSSSSRSAGTFRRWSSPRR